MANRDPSRSRFGIVISFAYVCLFMCFADLRVQWKRSRRHGGEELLRDCQRSASGSAAADHRHRFPEDLQGPRQALRRPFWPRYRCPNARLVFRHKLYQLREERVMKPETFASLVSALLYEKRFGPYFCQPVIAGLGDDDKPFICTMDSIGAKELAKDFVVAGTASESLYGACESMYKPEMEPEELFETISQALLSSVDRDCLSGWGGHVFVVTPSEVRERTLKSRMD